jgi:hypothetical protein
VSLSPAPSKVTGRRMVVERVSEEVAGSLPSE